MKKQSALLALALSVVGPYSFAQPAADVVIERTHKTIEVQSDGTFTLTSEALIRLVTEKGAKGGGQVPIPFSDSLQTLEILEAYTLKPDGARVDVPADKIFTQAAPVAVSAPQFNDIKMKIIVFPEPLAGGKLYFKVRAVQKVPHFPNHFSLFESVPTAVAIESFTLTVSAPNELALKTDARGMGGGKLADAPGAADAKGRTRWEWKFANATARRPEPFELSGTDFGPYVAMSSFDDWGVLAKAYRDRASSKSAVNAEIKALADELTKGVTDRRKQAQALYQWVARNVRYVGVFLGLGGYVPREAGDILKTKYGDCKDHTVILESLLQAKGIDSTPVLISLLPSFQLPKVPSVGSFNHAITYVPSLDMYLDSTSAFTRFASIPDADAGKPVLQIDGGKLSHTPVAAAEMDMVFNRVEMTLMADGSLSGHAEIVTAGEPEARLRQMVSVVPANEKDKFVPRMLGTAQKAEGTYASSDPHDLNQPFTLSATFEIKEAVNLQSPGAFPMPRGFSYGDVHHKVTTGGLNKETRGTPFKCGSGTVVEHFTLELPAEVKVSSLPKNVTHKEKSYWFEATYRQDGNKIIVQRKLVAQREREYCDPSMWEEVVRMSSVLTRDARAQVLIQ